MMCNQMRVVTATVVSFIALAAGTAGAVTQYNGVLGSAEVAPGFIAATATHAMQHIDFDDDGFIFGSKAYTPIPPDHYLAQGVTLLNLDARDVGTLPWAHSPPIGAWHTGFGAPITTPYSFVFTRPVASFGMFFNDVEAPIAVAVQLTLTTGVKTFTIPIQGSAHIGQFHGFSDDLNVIQRIDFTTTDYHLIDDVRFGYVPEPASLLLLMPGLVALATSRRCGRACIKPLPAPRHGQ